MDGDEQPWRGKSTDRLGRVVLRGEFGALLQAALPDVEITVVPGKTHLRVHMRDQAEAFGVLNRLRDLGAEIIEFTIDER